MCTHSSKLGGLAGLLLAIAVFGSSTAPAWSQVPQRIVHQGVLQDADGIALPDGPHAITFTMHDAAEGGATLWTEEHPAVETSDGLFHVILGSIAPLDVAFDGPLWLGMAVDGSPPLAPRLELTSSPYSLTARSVVGETNVFPSDGDVGIGTGGVAGKSQQTAGIVATPQAKLDVEGDLRIGVVEEATDAAKVLVQEDADQIVKYVPVEDLTGGGFSLPFAGTVNVPQPAFAATNEGGAALQGTSDDFTAVEGRSLGGTGVFGRATTGDGVVGESDDGAGVSGSSDTDRGVMGTSTTGPGVNGESNVVGVLGTSTGGIGVEGGSPDAVGVKAVSTTGIGIEASGLPAGQFNGTVRIVSADPAPTDLPFGRVGPPVGAQKSRLFIEEVEEDPNEERFLVWSADQFVRYRTPEELGGGIFDGILDNTALVVNDAAGAEVVRADPETGLSLNCDGKADCGASFNAQLHVVDDNGNSIFNADPETGLEFDCQGKPDCEASFVAPARFGLCVGIASCTTLTGDGLTLENGAALTFSDGTTQTTGFNLPFQGTADVAQPAFHVENVGGDGISGVSQSGGRGVSGVSDAGTGVGVRGESTEGIGVDAFSASGTGLHAISNGGTAVSALSFTGPGLEVVGTPAARLKGTVEVLSAAGPSRLKIQEMEEDPNEEKILVWSADQFVRYKTLDESGFDGVLNNTALVITDGTGAETTRINPDGTSFHEGVETFRGGIALEGAGVGLTFSDGTTQTTGFGLPFSGTTNVGQTAFEVQNQGGNGVAGVSQAADGVGVQGLSTSGIGVMGFSSTGTGLEAFGAPAADLYGTVNINTDPVASRPSRLKIEQLDEDPNEEKILVWSADQFVRYKTLDESGFDGVLNNTALVITDGAGTETTRINPDGTSVHEGLETFRGGIALDGAGVGITFNDGTTQTTGFGLPFSGTTNVGQTAFRVTNQGGDGIEGVSNVSGGFGVAGNAADGVAVSGISVSGKGVHGFSLGSTGVLGESGTGTGLAAFGAPAARLNGTVEIVTDGTNARPSRLKIQEMEADPNEEKILVWSADQFVRYKTLDESGFDGVLNNTDLIITDGTGAETTRINADGASFHKGLETFSGGIAVDNAESITFHNDLGSPTAQFNATDGSGYQACTDADANGALDAGECKAACDGVECRFNDHTSWGDCASDEACGAFDANDGFRFDLRSQLSPQSEFTVNYGSDQAFIAGGLTNNFTTLRLPGIAAANLTVGHCGFNGPGSTNGCWRFYPGLGSMQVEDQAGVTFMFTDAASQLLSVENLSVNNLTVNNALDKPAGSFKIDHPLDPENKYLYHSFVESPDMMNVYNGNVVLDGTGKAVIVMPEWFEALNRDFRYQLTPIGGPGPGLYIAEEIADGRFTIAGGTPGLKVSWMVTGIRHDLYAEQHRIPVEVEKPTDEMGTYLHPELYGRPAEEGLSQLRRNGTIR